MSTVACAAIQILDPVPGFPSSWLSVDGAIFLDLDIGFDFAQSKVVEELLEGNLQISAVYGVEIPKTPKNDFILRNWEDPNTFDFKPVGINVIAYTGGSVMTQRFLFVTDTRWRDGKVSVALVNDESHWAVGASRLKLNQIEYDDFAFTYNGVLDNMINNSSYSDGDAGIYFQMANYGNLYSQRRVNVEYMRPWYHTLGVLRKGFKQLGWLFRCPVLESPKGRQIISYLLDPEFFEVKIDSKRFLAKVNPFTVDQIYTKDTVGQDRVETIIYDDIIDDPSGSYTDGKYYGFGEFIVEASILYNSHWNVIHYTAIEIVVYDGILTEPKIVKVIKGGVKAGYAEQRELFLKTDDPITLLPGQWIEIRYRGSSNGVSDWIDNILGGTLTVIPTKVFPVEGDTINPGLMLRKDYFIDLCKGVLHCFRGKVDTQYDCKTIWFYPNYHVIDFFGDQVEGFYNNGELVTVDGIQIDKSERTVPPDFSRDRYLLIGYKRGNDTKVKQLEKALQYPLHSRLVDLGEEYRNDTTEDLNPYFEATANDWVNWSRIDNGIPLDIPHCLDHEPKDDKIVIGTNIGPRIIITRGWDDPRYKASDGSLKLAEWDFGNYLIVITPKTSYTWGFDLALAVDNAGNPPAENIVYGELDLDWYNKFWKRWVHDFLKSFKIDLLVYMLTKDYTDWNFRSVYALLTGGKRTFAYLTSINQFQACRDIPTQAVFVGNSSSAVGTQFPETPSQDDPCDNYTYELSWTEVAGVYTFSATSDSPGALTIEWRFHDVTTWTVGTVVSNPDRLFYVRVKDPECGNKVVAVQPIDPCGKNFPVLVFEYRYDDGTMEHCVTATIGGLLEDPILSTNFLVSIDSGTPTAYTIGTEVCGATVDFCFTGDVQMDNDCDPIPLNECFQVPPVVVNCEDNIPTVEGVLIGLDAYNLKLAGTIVSPPATWHFQYRNVGDTDEKNWKIWDTKAPIVKSTFDARVVMYYCDLCPSVCSDWVTIPTPPALTISRNTTSMEWDFSKLTDDDWNQVELMVAQSDYKGLMKLHNDKELSTNHYCCGADKIFVKNWFNHGLRFFRRPPE